MMVFGYRLTSWPWSKPLNESGKLLEIGIKLKKLVFTGVLHCSTNTVGIKTIEFALPVRNVENEMMMLSPEGGMTSLTVTQGRKLKSNSYLTVCMLKVKIKGQLKLTTSWQSSFSSSSLEYMVEAKNIWCLCFKTGLEELEPGHQPLMNLYGHSGTRDIRTASLLPKMCCSVTSHQVELGLLHQK